MKTPLRTMVLESLIVGPGGNAETGDITDAFSIPR